MLNLKKILYVLLFTAVLVNAQVKKIRFVSDENQLPIANVEVYDGNLLIGKSDTNGYLDIKIGVLNNLYIIKEDYRESIIKVSNLDEKVILVKKKPIELKGAMVGEKTTINIKKLLNSIQDNFDKFDGSMFYDQGKYKLPHYFEATNKLLTATDTLLYLNGIMKFEKVNGWAYQIAKNPRLIKNYRYVSTETLDQRPYEKTVYYLNKKDFELYAISTYFYSIDDDHILSENILKKRNNYDYLVTDIGKYYKVEFMFKNESPFNEGFLNAWMNWRENVGFNGYLVIDKKDFGIYEFNAHLSNKNSKYLEQKVYNTTINIEQKYHVNEINYNIKYLKDIKGNYQLEYCYYNEQFQQIEGNVKGEKFSYSSEVYAIDKVENAEFVNFDLNNFELK